MSHAALRLAGITKRYRSNTVLGPIDLSLEEGRIYGLIGENGAGKSTLIRIVMGLSKPTSGTVELIGQRGVSRPAERAVEHRLRPGFERELSAAQRCRQPQGTLSRMGAGPATDSAHPRYDRACGCR